MSARSFAIAIAAAALLLSTASAPFQCASEPNHSREDSPPEVLFELAEQFYERGDREAGRSTLEYLIERYPNSRYRTRAEHWLSEGSPPRTGPESGDTEH